MLLFILFREFVHLLFYYLWLKHTPTNEPTLNILPLLLHAFEINDFQIGIQLCDINAGEDVGETLYTPWLRNGGGWTAWASNRQYTDPDGIRIGLFGRHNTAVGDTEFNVKDTDIRFCIQLSDSVSHELGNSRFNGLEKCTPWSSAGGGWSDFAGDQNFKNYDAVRVKLDTQAMPGLLVTDVEAGIRVTDDGTNPVQMGYKEYTDWLIGAKTVTSSWSNWAGDADFSNPDAIQLHLGVHMSFTVTSNTENSPRVRRRRRSRRGNSQRRKRRKKDDDGDSVEAYDKIQQRNDLLVRNNQLDTFEIIGLFMLAVITLVSCICAIVFVCHFWKNKNDNVIRVPTNEEDDNDETDIGTDDEVDGIRVSISYNKKVPKNK